LGPFAFRQLATYSHQEDATTASRLSDGNPSGPGILSRRWQTDL